MPITIAYIGKAVPDAKRKKAETNLRALLADLGQTQLFLLKFIGVHILFHETKNVSGFSDYAKRTIELSLREFSRFAYRVHSTTPNQRWAAATLKEEVLHYLATHMAFDCSPRWKAAVAEDLKVRNRLRDKLCKAQRAYDSSTWEIKISIREYAEKIPLQKKISDFLEGEWEPAQEYLVDLLLVRDYLEARRYGPEKIRDLLNEAFPWTYELALKFEKSLGLEAARYAAGKKPRQRKSKRRKPAPRKRKL